MKKYFLLLLTLTLCNVIGITTSHAQPDQDTIDRDKIVRRMWTLIRNCAQETGATKDTLYESRVGQKYKDCILKGDEASLVASDAFKKQQQLGTPWLARPGKSHEITAFVYAWAVGSPDELNKPQDGSKKAKRTITDFNQDAVQHLIKLINVRLN